MKSYAAGVEHAQGTDEFRQVAEDMVSEARHRIQSTASQVAGPMTAGIALHPGYRGSVNDGVALARGSLFRILAQAALDSLLLTMMSAHAATGAEEPLPAEEARHMLNHHALDIFRDVVREYLDEGRADEVAIRSGAIDAIMAEQLSEMRAAYTLGTTEELSRAEARWQPGGDGHARVQAAKKQAVEDVEALRRARRRADEED